MLTEADIPIIRAALRAELAAHDAMAAGGIPVGPNDVQKGDHVKVTDRDGWIVIELTARGDDGIWSGTVVDTSTIYRIGSTQFHVERTAKAVPFFDARLVRRAST